MKRTRTEAELVVLKELFPDSTLGKYPTLLFLANMSVDVQDEIAEMVVGAYRAGQRSKGAQVTLKMFCHDDCDYVIAESEEDASKAYIESLGDPGCEFAWSEIPNDKIQKWWMDKDGVSAPGEPGALPTSVTVGELIEKFGRGYCGSTEY